MFHNIQLFGILAGGAFVLMVVGGVAGGILERSTAASEEERAMWGKVSLAVFGFLFLILSLAVVPLFLRLFTHLQSAIGNGDVEFVRFFRDHERTITYTVWTIFFCVCLFALPQFFRELSSK
jgi:hypothetical protein